MEELNCETTFTIPVFGGIPVAESVVVTWVIMAVLLVEMCIRDSNDGSIKVHCERQALLLGREKDT